MLNVNTVSPIVNQAIQNFEPKNEPSGKNADQKIDSMRSSLEKLAKPIAEFIADAPEGVKPIAMVEFLGEFIKSLAAKVELQQLK